MSKKQMKKLKKQEEWGSKLQEIKRKKKERVKEKKKLQKKVIEEKKNNGEDISGDVHGIFRYRRGRGYKKELNEKLANAPVLLVDCSFDQYHKKKELVSMCRQLEYCINILRKHDSPLRIVVSGLSDQFEEVLKIRAYQNWPIEFRRDSDLCSMFSQEKLVYLTGDSNEEMDRYEEDKVYVIGGIVDHNKLKNITLNKAKEMGIATKKFPISQYMQLKSSTILSINHSFELLMKVHNGYTWEGALQSTIPERKVETNAPDEDSDNLHRVQTPSVGQDEAREEGEGDSKKKGEEACLEMEEKG